jgi:hypothetical protein
MAVLARAHGVAAQAPTGTVAGRVVQLTAEAALPPGLTVTLRSFAGQVEGPTRTAAVAADGTFHFEGLPGAADTAYVAQVGYGDIVYYSAPVAVEQAGQTVDLTIEVAETTTDVAGLCVARLNLVIVALAADRVQVAESYRLANNDDRTVVAPGEMSGAGVTWHLPLPAGAEAAALMSGSAADGLRLSENALDVALPIRPGQNALEVRLTYQLPYTDGMALERDLDLPVDEVVVAVPVDSGPLVGAPGFGAAEQMDTGMGAAYSYRLGPLAAEEALRLTLSGTIAAAEAETPALDQSAGRAVQRNMGLEAGVGAGVLIVCTATAVWVWGGAEWRRRRERYRVPRRGDAALRRARGVGAA